MKNLKQIRKSIPFLRYTKMMLFAFVLIFAITSCSKSSDDEDDDGDGNGYMISFKANNVLQEFTSDHFPIGAIYDNGTQYTLLSTGTRSSSSVGVQVYDNKTITEKNYSGYAVTQATQQSSAYVIGAAISYSESQTIYITPFDNPTVNVTIEKITPTTIRGSFSGTLKANGKPDLVVTNGKFFVPRGNIPN